MDLLKAISERHSVRSYTDRPITGSVLSDLRRLIDRANADSGLHIQLVLDEPQAFDCRMAHYGSFRNVRSYIALIGRDDKELEEKCGYYGERIVIGAQGLGLNTCWVALSYKKVEGFYTIAEGEKLMLVIAIGYGATDGKEHRSKSREKVARNLKDAPAWFLSGVDCALLAPTAMNQQKFILEYADGKVIAKAKHSPCSKIDLGIVKYHFEIGSGKGHDIWA